MAKFKITADNPSYTREIGGVHFVDGVGETDNENVARWLESRGGFTVESGERDLHQRKSLSQMNSEELDVYAAELGVELPEGSKVAEKKELIKAYLEQRK